MTRDLNYFGLYAGKHKLCFAGRYTNTYHILSVFTMVTHKLTLQLTIGQVLRTYFKQV